MIDQTSPPFRAGDNAYIAPAPGGFASDADIPDDPAFGGADVAFAVPSLGGDFGPGSGAVTPTGSPIAKGASADGGAQAIEDAPRVDPVQPPVVPDPIPLSVDVTQQGNSFTLDFDGGTAAAPMTVSVNYQVNAEAARQIDVVIPPGTLGGAAAAYVYNALMQDPELTVDSMSNRLTVKGNGANNLAAMAATVA